MTRQEQTEISLGANFHGAIISGAGTKIELDSGGNVDVYTDCVVKVHPAIKPDTKPEVIVAGTSKIGDVMPTGDPHAGWIYAGISKTTKAPFYAAPKDSGVFRWNEMMAFAAKEKARVPSNQELDQLYGAREAGALKRTFNVSGSTPAGWYWSATEDRDHANCAWGQRFDNGYRAWDDKASQLSLRLVRS
jgi:Protein of unknown function (DUF1566)